MKKTSKKLFVILLVFYGCGGNVLWRNRNLQTDGKIVRFTEPGARDNVRLKKVIVEPTGEKFSKMTRTLFLM